MSGQLNNKIKINDLGYNYLFDKIYIFLNLEI